MFLNTFFSVSEAVLFAQLVDRLDQVRRRRGSQSDVWVAVGVGVAVGCVDRSRGRGRF